MPFLVQTKWNGKLHHALEYGNPDRVRERLGTRNAPPIEISDKMAGAGLDVLVRLYFPEPVPIETDLGGEHW